MHLSCFWLAFVFRRRESKTRGREKLVRPHRFVEVNYAPSEGSQSGQLGENLKEGRRM